MWIIHQWITVFLCVIFGEFRRRRGKTASITFITFITLTFPFRKFRRRELRLRRSASKIKNACQQYLRTASSLSSSCIISILYSSMWFAHFCMRMCDGVFLHAMPIMNSSIRSSAGRCRIYVCVCVRPQPTPVCIVVAVAALRRALHFSHSHSHIF